MSPAGRVPRPSIWRATVVDPLDYFPERDVARARQYQRPLRRARLLRAGLSLSVTVAVLLLGVAPAIVDRLDEVVWPVQLLVILLVLEFAMAVIDGTTMKTARMTIGQFYRRSGSHVSHARRSARECTTR